jgi:hypothetical protein
MPHLQINTPLISRYRAPYIYLGGFVTTVAKRPGPKRFTGSPVYMSGIEVRLTGTQTPH